MKRLLLAACALLIASPALAAQPVSLRFDTSDEDGRITLGDLFDEVVPILQPEADRAGEAKEVFHTFVIGVYFFPLLGAIVSDVFLAKFRTIISFSLVYVTGCFVVAFGSGETPLVIGLLDRKSVV